MQEQIASLAYKSMDDCRKIAISTAICDKAIILHDLEAIAHNIARMKQLLEEQNSATSS